MRPWLQAIAIVALLAAVVALQIARDRLVPLQRPAAGGTILYVQSPAAVRRLALSFDALAADLYWIRAIQHYGSTKLSTERNKSYDQLYPLLDLTTSLDPHFSIAYRFGAIFLSEPFPNGPGRPDLAIALLQKGLAAQPGRWEFAQDIGFVHYWWLREPKQGAEWFLRAAAIPGAPNWLKPLAAVTLAEGGNRALSRQLWREVHDNADVVWLRDQAELRLRQLDAMDHMDLLRRQAADYEQRTGRLLQSWQQLVDAGYLRRVPADPAGLPYVLDPARAMITLHPDSPLNPLPLEPVAIQQVPGVR